MSKHINYSEVRWKNFKGYKDTGWIKIKPITIILGSNNSGKTNFLAPLLLMNQTVNSRDIYSPLILKGDVYDGGNFQEIAKDYNWKNEIFFGCRYHIHSSDKKLDQIGTYPPGAFEVTFKVDKKDGEIKLKKKTIYDVYKRKFLSLTLTASGKYKYSGLDSTAFSSLERKVILKSKPINFVFSSNTILADLESTSEKELLKKERKKTSQFTRAFSQFLAAISYSASTVRTYLGGMSFIGPIRESPHRIYEITNETDNTVGIRGENLANLIKKIGSNNGELNEWVKRFGFGDKLQLQHHFSNTYSLRFLKNSTSSYTTIANAGFGASQVLPLIVQALISKRGSLTIAEQPEIHLNPSIQCVLADLFVSMANKGQTVIVETHSEHLLLRLRRLVAEEKIKSEDVAIYFVEKNEAGDSEVREINLQKNGHISSIDWPKNFFSETLKESLALAEQQSKRKK